MGDFIIFINWQPNEDPGRTDLIMGRITAVEEEGKAVTFWHLLKPERKILGTFMDYDEQRVGLTWGLPKVRKEPKKDPKEGDGASWTDGCSFCLIGGRSLPFAGGNSTRDNPSARTE